MPIRIGIWGWSGGGSQSQRDLRYLDVYHMAMLSRRFRHRYYDSILSGTLLRTASRPPDEYKQSSPITFVVN
jgi:dipeptidyl-peptidase-4